MKTKNLFLILLCLVLSGCINLSVLTKKGHQYKIDLNGATIQDAKPSDWHVGPKGKQIVHRGIKVKIGLPKISKEDLKELRLKRRVDSIIILIERMIRGTKIPIGYLNIPIGTKGSLPKVAFFFIDYYAAGIRPSHTSYSCPPYGHDYKILGVSIKNKKIKKKSITISSQYEKRIKNSKTSRFVLNGQHFVAGRDVLGQYYFKLAFFSQSEKVLKSEFYNFDEYISVPSHVRKTIKGCPANTGSGILRDNNKFKWKR